jgi:hypothetical protein
MGGSVFMLFVLINFHRDLKGRDSPRAKMTRIQHTIRSSSSLFRVSSPQGIAMTIRRVVSATVLSMLLTFHAVPALSQSNDRDI